MRITKYPQSHLVIESHGSSIMIDPGDFTFDKGFQVAYFAKVQAILITHSHFDHMAQKNSKVLKELSLGKQVYGNIDVIAKLNNLGIQGILVEEHKKFTVAGFEIEPIDLPHFPDPLGTQMPPNTGYVINGIFFHPGDGNHIDGLSVDNAAIPIGHSSVSTMSALEFAKSIQAKLVIPIHYDSYQRDPNEFAKFGKQLGIEVRILSVGEATEI